MTILFEEVDNKHTINEGKGYVSYFDQFIKDITPHLITYISRKRFNGADLTNKDAFRKQYQQYGHMFVEKYLDPSIPIPEGMSSGNFINSVSVDREYLQECGIDNVYDIAFYFEFTGKNEAGNIKPGRIKKEKDGLFHGINVSLNLFVLLPNIHYFESTLHHELAHAYEAMQRIDRITSGYPSSDFIDHVPTEDMPDIVQKLSYYCAPHEQNAFISSIGYLLKQFQPSTKEEAKLIYTKSEAGEALEEIENALEMIRTNEDACVQDIFAWKARLPEHEKTHDNLFPSNKGMTIQRYQKRLYSSISMILNRYKKRIDRIVDAYFNGQI